MLRLIRATSREDAKQQARAMCACLRKSFKGVRWVENDVMMTLLWSEV